VEQGLINKGIMMAGVWYKVEAFTTEGPDIGSELCCGWGHREYNCGNKPKCGYC
jgi:hypothetical protein